MDTRELRYFAQVVEKGSLTQASKAIGISQPALTKALRLLEARLGVKLLRRDAKGVTATDYGRTLYERAKSITAELARAEEEISELSRNSAGLVSVGVLPSQATNVLPEASIRLLASRPELRLRVIEKPLGDLEAAVRRGEFDFIISIVDLEKADGSLAHKILFYDRPTIVVRRGHPLLELNSIGPKDLAKFPWILPPPGSERRAYIDGYLKSAGSELPIGAIECRSVSFVKTIVMQTDYIGLLPNDEPTQEGRAGLLRELKLEPKFSTRAIGALYRADYPLTDIAQSFLREISKACLRLGYSTENH